MSGDTSLGFAPSTMSPELVQILSARSALRVLDTSIARTEARLRALHTQVPSGGSGGGGSGGSAPSPRMGGRKNGSSFKMGRNKLEMGPLELGSKGLGLNGGFLRFGGKMVTTMVGFHVLSGIGSQMMDLAQRQRELEQAGAGGAERRTQAVMDVGRGVVDTAATLFGIKSLAETTLRAGGFTKEGAGKAVEEVFDALFTHGAAKERKNAAMKAALGKAGADVRKEFADAYTYLGAWTPDDFDVTGDIDRKDLQADMLRLNAGRLEAWADDAHNMALRKAERDSRGD